MTLALQTLALTNLPKQRLKTISPNAGRAMAQVNNLGSSSSSVPSSHDKINNYLPITCQVLHSFTSFNPHDTLRGIFNLVHT